MPHLDLNVLVQLLTVLGIAGVFWRMSGLLERLSGAFDEHAKTDREMFRMLSQRIDTMQMGRYLDSR